MGAVLVWGTILGIGAWRLNNDPRRLLVVLACVIAFVGFWALMLAARARRRRRD
jgi:protein-S-isoprenylcysteine O-methyltransferase Ste14